MNSSSRYYLVAAEVLPEIFIKVAEANRLLKAGEVATAGDAAKAVGISRSAFYKYRDSIMPFQNMSTGRIVTFQMMLHDKPGVLSSLLMIFVRYNANIQTINSITPTNGSALVTITAEASDMIVPLEELLESLRSTEGVIKTEILAG